MDDYRYDRARFGSTTEPAGGPHAAPGDPRDSAGELGERAKQQGKAMAAQRKDAAAGQMGSVAQALHKTADDLRGSQHPQAGRYVGYAAEQLEGLGQRLRDNDIDSLIGQAESLGRRSPVAFFAGAVAAGFLASRFLRSSAGHRHDELRHDELRHDALRDGEPRADDSYGAAWQQTRTDPTHQDLLDPDSADAGVYAGSNPLDTGAPPTGSPYAGRDQATPSRDGGNT